MRNYLQTAQEHESAFKAILARSGFEHDNLNAEQIYVLYSSGNRIGIVTILDFEQIDTNSFAFSWENSHKKNGIGKKELWSVNNGEVTFVRLMAWWYT